MTAVRTPPATARSRAGVATAPRRTTATPRPATRPLRRVDTPPRSKPRQVTAPRHLLRRLVVVATVVGVVIVFAAVAFQALLVGSQGDLDNLERRISEQEQLLANQQLDITRLESPTRVVGAAQERLGMVAPSGIVYLRPAAGDDQAIALPDPAPATDEPDAGAGE